jgi:four helix bundle protein
MNYDEWVKTVPTEITADALWKVAAYRLGLLVSDLSWHDATKLMRDKRTLDLSDQLYRAVGSISANIAEGYSRGSNKDRARFYEYSLGSARESRDWYYKSRFVLGDQISNHRLSFLTQIVRLLLTMVPDQRGRTLHDEQSEYRVNDNEELSELLKTIPLPEL